MPATNSPKKPDKMKSSYPVKMVVRLIVTAAILFLLFKNIPLEQVLSTMGQTDVRAVAAAFLMTFLTHLGASLRLKKLCEIQALNLSAFEVFKINTSARFYSLFLPAGNFTGIAIRFYRLSIVKRKYKEAIVAMFGDRIFATISLCIVGMVFWTIEWPEGTALYFVLMLVTFLSLSAILMAARFISPDQVHSLLARLLNRFTRGKFDLIIMNRENPSRRRSWMIVSMLFLSVVVHVFGILSYYLICNALALDLSFISIGWIRSAIILATMVPISISGIGLREGATVILLSYYNIPADAALALSIIIFAVTVLGVGLIGGIFEGLRLFK